MICRRIYGLRCLRSQCQNIEHAWWRGNAMHDRATAWAAGNRYAGESPTDVHECEMRGLRYLLSALCSRYSALTFLNISPPPNSPA